jgi:hypothetical protein
VVRPFGNKRLGAMALNDLTDLNDRPDLHHLVALSIELIERIEKGWLNRLSPKANA